MKTCPICKEGNLTSGKTTVMLERNGSIVLLKFVPADICDTCESYFLDSSTTREVLKTANRSIQNGTELEVVRMQSATQNG
jgi:YgiT-type zinc finger domain-containing protein